MRKIVISILGCFICCHILAQNISVRTLPSELFRTVKKDASDTAKWKWKRGGMFNVNMSQGSLSNWAAGGDKFSMAATTYVNYFFLFKKKRHTWDNNIDLNFGFVQATSLGSRKNDDRLDYLSKYGFKLDSTGKYYMSGLFNFRSQFFDGYTYSGNNRTLSSTFLSPAYVLFSLGMDYKPFKNFSTFISPFTSRATVIASKRLYDQGLYGVPAGHRILNSIGAFSSSNYSAQISKNISYRGRLDLFSDYKHNPQNVDLYMTNLWNFKINKFMSATYSLDLIYDDDVKLFGPNKSPALQLKSQIGLGLSMQMKNRSNI